MYEEVQDAGLATTYQFKKLETNTTHYFTVTAHDRAGNESLPSQEVSKFIEEASGLVTTKERQAKQQAAWQAKTETFTARQTKQRAAWQAKTEAFKARQDQQLALFLEKNGASDFSMGQ